MDPQPNYAISLVASWHAQIEKDKNFSGISEYPLAMCGACNAMQSETPSPDEK